MFRFSRWGLQAVTVSALYASARSLHATPVQVALAWLLQRSPNFLLIPGTSSVGHLRENLNAATIEIPVEVLADIDASVEVNRTIDAYAPSSMLHK